MLKNRHNNELLLKQFEDQLKLHHNQPIHDAIKRQTTDIDNIRYRIPIQYVQFLKESLFPTDVHIHLKKA